MAATPLTPCSDPTPSWRGRAAPVPIGNTVLPVDSSERPRVTQSDIARIAGVHNTTVSLSLRNCQSIPEATRERIRAIADKMGYYPDPALQALIAYRKGRPSSRPREVLAYVTDWGTRCGWRDVAEHERAYVGANRKAVELGYNLEHFWLGEPGMSARRLSDVLYHRGIKGALVAAHVRPGDEPSEFDWSRLSAVKIGCYPHFPLLHRVTEAYSGMVRLAIRRVLSAGFDRVGLIMAQWWDDEADQSWSAGFLVEQSKFPVGRRIPILHSVCSRQEWTSGAPSRHSQADSAAIAKWYQAYRPEVIIGFSPLVSAKIRQLGINVPEDVAYVDLCAEEAADGCAGTRPNREIVGEVAVALLVTQIQKNLYGPPSVATSTTVDGTWLDGASMPTAAATCLLPGKLEIHSHVGDGALLATG